MAWHTTLKRFILFSNCQECVIKKYVSVLIEKQIVLVGRISLDVSHDIPLFVMRGTISQPKMCHRNKELSIELKQQQK